MCTPHVVYSVLVYFQMNYGVLLYFNDSPGYYGWHEKGVKNMKGITSARVLRPPLEHLYERYTGYILGIFTAIFWVDITVVYSAVWSEIRLFGFVFIRPYVQVRIDHSVVFIWQRWTSK